jgi:hypothetical protein
MLPGSRSHPCTRLLTSCSLLAPTLRGLRRLATGPLPRTPNDWEGRRYGRLSALPDQAQPLQRSQLMAAFSVGSEIIQLRRIGLRLDLGANFDAALEAMAGGDDDDRPPYARQRDEEYRLAILKSVP